MLKLMEKYKKLPLPLKASLWFLICGVIQKGLAMVTTPIFTRILTTAEYGEYSVFNSWHNILTVFITLNLTAGVYSQGLVKFSEDREKFSSSLYGLTLLLSAVVFVIYIAGHKLWNSLIGLSTIVMVCMLVMTCVSTFFGFWSAKQRVDYKYKTLIILTLSIAVVRPVSEIAAMILFPNAKVTARIIAITVIDILVYIWLLFAQIKKDAHLYDGFYWKYALKFNIPLVPHYLSTRPFVPSAPAGPTGPCGPTSPWIPWGPCGPVKPMGPCGPVAPVAPTGPWGPVAPVAPVGPIGPTAPVAPVKPLGPRGPRSMMKIRLSL